MNRLDRIKALRAQDYGVASLSPDDIDWLIEQAAEIARLRAWHDAVMAQGAWYADCDDECVQVIVRPKPMEVKP